jgi:hypothetical protein
MSMQFLQQNWAVLGASVLGVAIALFVIIRVFQDSTRGQLLRLVRTYDEKILAANKAKRRVGTAEARLRTLRARQDSAKPRHVQEASEALEDAGSLHNIAGDQVLIAANHVRKFILEEFPPNRHESLREKYLSDQAPDKKPFTFQ